MMRQFKRSLLVTLALVLLFATACFSMAEELPIEGEPQLESVTLKDTADMDTAAQYIYQKLYGIQTRAPRIVGSRLKGVDKTLYDHLGPCIVEVAAGLRESTVFSFPVEDIYPQVTFTKEDLGVEAIVSNGSFTPEAKAAIEAIRRSMDANLIISALAADYPYELYWFNKSTSGNTIIAYPGYTGTSKSVTLTGNVALSMAVSQEYALGNYTVDTSYGQAVSQAAETARRITAKYASYSDFDRLSAYKDEICALVSYNHDVEEKELEYGNPWQIIWVFDGNDETNVVCEGYAKAFQYLNDLSSSRVTVISVSGKMDGVAHMWNIVTMDDGRNYMADITNCDEGGLGYPDRLFLKGYIAGNVHSGYDFQAQRRVHYQYTTNTTSFSEDDYWLAPWDYLAGGPPSPVFTCGQNVFYANELVTFQQQNTSYPYDELLVEITCPAAEGEEPAVATEPIQVDQNGQWRFGENLRQAGEYSLRFVGVREKAQAWSKAVSLEMRVLGDLGLIAFVGDIADTVSSGGEVQLAWNCPEEGISAFGVEVYEEQSGLCVWQESYAASESGGLFHWAVSPDTYEMRLVPLVESGYLYQTEDEGRTVTVTESGEAWYVGDDGTLKKYFGVETAVSIPQEVNGTAVTAVGRSAFRHTAAQQVTLPQWINSVESGAFSDSANLQEVTVPRETLVAQDAFQGSTNVIVFGYSGTTAQDAAEAAQVRFVSLDTPSFTLSTQTGYVGYKLAIQMDQTADRFILQETGEEFVCEGTILLIPLTEAGEYTFSFSAERAGKTTEISETAAITVSVLEGGVLTVPAAARQIGESAFQGIQAGVVIIPKTVTEIGPYAFADNAQLKMVEMGEVQADETAFANCPHAVFGIENVAWGFEKHMNFLVK